MNMKLPELLCPAGSAPAMVAAVQCGADAVYLGAGDFNARKGADNFGGELDAAVGYCHARDAKVYVTLNTMVRQDELSRLETTISEICRAGADGVIVQDFGVARAIRQMAPSLPLHASTQMAVHNPQGVDFLVKQGFTRVVLAREMEYAEIARCANRGAELEVFVHGALCVSCSGQCLLSSMIGGRSGNRGLCAQPCRMKYRMDEREGYLLSTKDLCGLDGLQALIQAGADSLKIEGRLKRPEYVALAASAYRAALDKRDFDLESAKRELAQMFNRGGFTRGYGFGVNDAELMYHSRPNHIGVEVGVCKRNGDVQLFSRLDPKDALVLRRPGCEDIPVKGGSFANAKKGDKLVRLVSEAQMRDMREKFIGEKKKFPVDISLQLKVGSPAAIEISDGARSVSAEGETVQQAQNRPADPDRIRSQLEKLGDTPFYIRNYAAEIDHMAYLPVSALNALRRIAVEKLFEARFGDPHPCGPMEQPEITPAGRKTPELIAQSGNPEILRRALEAGADRAVFAPEDVRIDALNAALETLPDRFGLALPQVLAEDSLNTLHRWANENAARIDRCYIANVGQLGLAWPGERIAGASLNLANGLSIAQMRDWGMDAYVPSLELNKSQIDALGGRRHLTVYGAIPLMHLRHCPLRATLGLRGQHRDCRRCDSCGETINQKSLADRTGASFPLRRTATENGCVIQLKNSAKLMLLRKSLPACEGWLLLLDEGDPIEAVVRLHKMAICGENFRADPAWPLLDEMNTTTGHYFRGAE
ncbi:MAG: U32 family peptidase [Clostridia bacterium]|nr:U32 family peptidase [Clostridia bacterium]